MLMALAVSPALGQTPKPGGWLNLRLREDLPQGFAIHESPTISTMWPSMPCLSNLVIFDPRKPTHSAETVIPELAEQWSWQENYTKLVFLLRRDVRWHDGKAFSASDVKHTFDILREVPDAPGKLRLNPRREWYANVEAIRGPRCAHGGLPPQAPATLSAADAGVGVHPDLRRARARRRLSRRMHRHGSVQAQGVAQGRIRRVREEFRLLREGAPVPRRSPRSDHRGGRNCSPPRSRPGACRWPSPEKPPRASPISSGKRRRCS